MSEFNYNDYEDGGTYITNAEIPEAPVKRKRKPKKGGVLSTLMKTIAFALIFGIVSGSVFAGIGGTYVDHRITSGIEKGIESEDEDQTEGAGTDTGQTGTAEASQVSDITTVVDNVMPSVVSITGKFQSTDYFGLGTYESEGAGSGFILKKTKDKLLIGTNNHVVEGGTSLTVGFVDETTAPAEIVGTDSDADLAVISVNTSDLAEGTIDKISTVTLGDSDSLRVGQSVIAIGNALGYGQSVTTGVISAKNRQVSFTDGTMTLLQTDAAVNPGNSGGVLIDTQGKVIGINNSKLEDTSVEGMCYAIPVDTAKVVFEELLNSEDIQDDEVAFLGIRGEDITTQAQQAYGMPAGVYVRSITEGSPAEKAGISAGDIITKFEGTDVSTMKGLSEKIARKKVGTKVKITLQRANQLGIYKEKEIEVTLGKRDDFVDSEQSTENGYDNGQNNNGGNNNNGGGNNGGETYPDQKDDWDQGDEGRDFDSILPYIFGH